MRSLGLTAEEQVNFPPGPETFFFRFGVRFFKHVQHGLGTWQGDGLAPA